MSLGAQSGEAQLEVVATEAGFTRFPASNGDPVQLDPGGATQGDYSSTARHTPIAGS
jgi:hypothetical protein